MLLSLLAKTKRDLMMSSYLTSSIKYNQSQADRQRMTTVTVVNQILEHILQEGKDIIKDKYLEREKVPGFVNNIVQDSNFEAAIQSGYQIINTMRNNYFSITKDKQPSIVAKQRLASAKCRIEKDKRNNEGKSPNQMKTKRSNSFSVMKNSKYKSAGFSTSQAQSPEKENQLIKLQQGNGKKIIIDRVANRQSMQQDQMRSEKQKVMLDQYKQKKAKDMFEKEKTEQIQTKEKQFREHTSRGKDHKYFYHEGELYLYKEDAENQLKVPHQTQYALDRNDEAESINSNIKKRSSHCFKRSQPKAVQEHFKPNQHHRIRSARGEVFASAVLKTINLSRISLNETLRNLEDEQFMKRNDLFNNNHSRQTTSIPYLLPKTGTVYTQLSTNQVVGDNKNQHDDKQSCSFRSETTKNPISNRRKSHFQPYLNHNYSVCSKSENVSERDQNEEEREGVRKTNPRSVRTAEAGHRRQVRSERRPQTSANKGRITTVNEDLVLALLK